MLWLKWLLFFQTFFHFLGNQTRVESYKRRYTDRDSRDLEERKTLISGLLHAFKPLSKCGGKRHCRSVRSCAESSEAWFCFSEETAGVSQNFEFIGGAVGYSTQFVRGLFAVWISLTLVQRSIWHSGYARFFFFSFSLIYKSVCI